MFFHLVILSGIDCVVSLSRDCGSVQGTCADEASIMYAWARNAPPTKLPKGMSLKGLVMITNSHIYSIHCP